MGNTVESERHEEKGTVSYTKPKSVVTREIAGQTLLVPVEGKLANLQSVFALDPVAAFIWERLETACDESDLVRAVVDSFDVDEATAAQDVRAFVECLREAGLIEGAASAATD